MKVHYQRLTTLAVTLLTVMLLPAQLVQDNEPALIYYMPKTQFVFTIHYDQTIREAGIYAEYADLLGITDPVTELDTTYSLQSVKVTTRVVPDTDRAYKVVASQGLNTQLLALTPQGILMGYNVENAMPASSAKSHDSKPSAPDHQRRQATQDTPLVIPFMEADMKASTPQAQAERIAQQIFQLRETRMFILAGEVDHYPADGKAMEKVLSELHEQENFLVSLFSGRTEVKHLHQQLTYTPMYSEEVVLANFNASTGFGEGESLMLTVAATKQVKAATTEPVNKKTPQPSQIYYNLPGAVNYSLIYQDNLLASGTEQVAQLGVAIPLTIDLFKEPVHMLFDTRTGNIKTIYK